MDTARFRQLLDAARSPETRFVSVYFDDSHGTADAAAQLDSRLRDIRKHLEDESIDAEVISAIDTAVRAAHPPVGRSGRGVIAAGSTIVLDEHLIRPPVTTELRVSELPYLVPVVEHGRQHTTYLVVAVDHTGADITVHDGVHRVEHVEGSGHPVRAAHRAETANYGGPQGRVEEAVRKNLREVADRVTHLVDTENADIVFITGDARAELVSALPDRVASRAVAVQGGGRAAGTDQTEVAHEIGQEFLKQRLAAMDDAAQRFSAGLGSGLAVQGLHDVSVALRDGAVDTLIIGDLGDARVTAAVGDAPERDLRADEALPLLAVATGAALVRTDERISPADGIGAVLRYPDMGAR